MADLIMINEMQANNPYNTNTEVNKDSASFSRSLQDSPGGFTTDGQGNTTENKTSTVTAGRTPEGQQGDILKSARSMHGSPVDVINDDSVVSINGVTATVKSAVKAGLLHKHPDGTYSEVAKAAPVQNAQPTKRIDPLSPDSRTHVQNLESLVGKQNAENIQHRIASAAGKGEGLTGIQKELADLAGVQPEVTKSIVEGIATDLDNRMTHDLINGFGMTQPQALEMLDWSYKNLTKQHVSAMFSGAMYGDSGAMNSAFEKYRLSQRKINNQ